jgi:hypothetical protein
MPDHDEYGKQLFADILGTRWRTRLDSERSVEMGGVRADLDGVIRSTDGSKVECSVEIEARVYKQIRGAIVDLAWHHAPKKLLVIIPAQPQLGNEERIRRHCTYVWTRLTRSEEQPFRLAVLVGTGTNPRPSIDRDLLVAALRELDLIL